MSEFTLFLQTNSPGELSNWAIPIARAFKKLKPETMVQLCLVPCQYASGHEVRIAQESPHIDAVWTPKETLSQIRKPTHKKKAGLVMFCGGDPLYAQLMSLRFRLPAFGYSAHADLFAPVFKKLYYKKNVGDLMSDNAFFFRKTKQEAHKETRIPTDKSYLLYFTGSRPAHFRAFLPMIVEAHQHLKHLRQDYGAILMISPFIDDKVFQEVTATLDLSDFIIRRENSLAVMKCANLLITLPGTNTAEAMYMGLPMLGLLPTNRPDLIQLDGLIGLLGNLPFIGINIKRLLIFLIRKTRKYYILPNMVSQSKLCPEVIGHLTPVTIADHIWELTEQDHRLRDLETALAPYKPNTSIAEQLVTDILARLMSYKK